MTDPLSLIRLLQLASPALPVGAYTYSQGLEWGVESGEIHDEATTLIWIGGLLEYNVGQLEAPLLAALLAAWENSDEGEVRRLNREFLASRETAELRAESLQMGYSLQRMAEALPDLYIAPLLTGEAKVAFPTVWAALATAWKISPSAAVHAYLWSWCENQVMAAVKIVPLGQSAGQRLLAILGARIPAVAAHALTLPEEQWCNFAPGLAITSCLHETQYSRLFRS